MVAKQIDQKHWGWFTSPRNPRYASTLNYWSFKHPDDSIQNIYVESDPSTSNSTALSEMACLGKDNRVRATASTWEALYIELQHRMDQ
ncbi:hypothetical protein [Marinomonas sp. 2405UD68-3]|uniref:hypothetical protein n=1 Tax=Marinomonas sp. 2405UD68-3 TaxID=3391835 RepID=UPI0039C993DB